MRYNPVCMPSNVVEISPLLQSIPLKMNNPSTSMIQESLPHLISTPALAERSVKEIGNYRNGEAHDERYCLELLRRATVQGDGPAWECLQQIFSDLIRGWLRRHPRREEAYRLDSEENYVAQTIERFWRATTLNQKLEFSTIAAALRYLRASLNGAILDTIRACIRHREVTLPEPGFSGEPFVEDEVDGGELWEILKGMLHGEREQYLAYLLFHCGLKPREIAHHRPDVFNDVHEVYRLRRNIIERLQRNADQIRRRLALV